MNTTGIVDEGMNERGRNGDRANDGAMNVGEPDGDHAYEGARANRDDATTRAATSGMRSGDELSRVLVLLLKGVVYRDVEPAMWSQLLARQSRARDYLAMLGLDLGIDEAEGYAFVRSRAGDDDDPDAETLGGRAVPRLVARRPLSFPVSLLLALLRRKLAEADARGGDSRLVLSRTEIADLVRVFLPERADEARLLGQIDAHIGKVVDLGFLKRLGGANSSGPPTFEVRRIIKAFVDAQWLAEFDVRLGEYRAALERDLTGPAPSGSPASTVPDVGTDDDR